MSDEIDAIMNIDSVYTRYIDPRICANKNICVLFKGLSSIIDKIIAGTINPYPTRIFGEFIIKVVEKKSIRNVNNSFNDNLIIITNKNRFKQFKSNLPNQYV